jgi:molybdate transport system regulatory protein
MARIPATQTPQLHPRFRVVHRGDIALGPGKMELLALLVETGSLTLAAKQMDMSYMRAWTLMQTMNDCFTEPVVMAERGGKNGGGMKVTATGLRALELYREIESAAKKAATTPWRRLQKLLRA